MIQKIPLVFGVIWLYLAGTLAQRNCGNRFCMTSFHWCDSSPCDFPDNVFSIHNDIDDRNIGYGVILGTDEYNITWINADSNYPVSIEWRLLVGEDEPDYGGIHLSWGINTTDSHYVFKPYDLFAKMASSSEFDLTETEIRSLASGMMNVIFIGQPGKGDAEDVWQDMSSQFSVQNGWAILAAEAQYEIGKQKEADKWKLGVGIGVALGAPFLMAVTGLLTWWFAKKRLTSEAPKATAQNPKILGS